MRHIHDLATTKRKKLNNVLADRDGGRGSLGLAMDRMVEKYPSKYYLDEHDLVRLRNDSYSWPIRLVRRYLKISDSDSSRIVAYSITTNSFKDIALWITNNILTHEERRYMLYEYNVYSWYDRDLGPDETIFS